LTDSIGSRFPNWVNVEKHLHCTSRDAGQSLGQVS
jgi:hypothetical protein